MGQSDFNNLASWLFLLYIIHQSPFIIQYCPLTLINAQQLVYDPLKSDIYIL